MENHNGISEFIWNIKEHIRDEYAEKDYEYVILPFTLLSRIDCVRRQLMTMWLKFTKSIKTVQHPKGLANYVAGQFFHLLMKDINEGTFKRYEENNEGLPIAAEP